MVNPKDKEEDKGKSSCVPNSVVKRVTENIDLRVHRPRRSEWRRRWRPYGGRRFSRSFGKNSRLDDLENRKAKWLNLRMHVLGQPLAPYNTTQFLMDDHHVREPEFGHEFEFRLHQNNNSVPAATVQSSVSPKTTSVSTTNPLINNNSLNNNNNNNNYSKESNNNSDGKQSSINPNETKSPNYGGGGGTVGGHRRRCMSDSTPSRKNSEDALSDDFYSSPDDEQDFIQRQFFETYENIHAERISTMPKAELVKEYLLLEQRYEELESKLKQMEYSVELKT